MLARYQVNKNPLGKGSYGLVYGGVNKSTGKAVAIKHITDFTRYPDDAKRLLREVSLLRMLKHPKIVSLEYIATSAPQDAFNEIDLVFEHYQSDLLKIINSRQPLTTEHLQYFLYQILCGIDYIHSAGLVHRDLKPDNILVNINCDIAICDFGLARAIRVIKEAENAASSAAPLLFHQLTGYVVTRWYRSPELILGCRDAGSAPTDMWSIGCILAELMSFNPLFPGKSSKGVLDLILNLIGTPEQDDCEWIDTEWGLNYVTQCPSTSRQNFQQKFRDADAQALDLLEKLLKFNPNQRITAQQALQHPFFSSLYNPKDILTFPIQPRSAADQSSRDDYYQFETELDGQSSKSRAEITQWACELILKEIARYEPETLPALAVYKASAVPDSTSAVPDLTSAVPDLTSAVPDLTSAVPDPASAVPDLTSAVPDLTSAVPYLTSAVPDLTSAVPDLTSAVPDLTSAVPDSASAVLDPASTSLSTISSVTCTFFYDNPKTKIAKTKAISNSTDHTLGSYKDALLRTAK